MTCVAGLGGVAMLEELLGVHLRGFKNPGQAYYLPLPAAAV